MPLRIKHFHLLHPQDKPVGVSLIGQHRVRSPPSGFTIRTRRMGSLGRIGCPLIAHGHLASAISQETRDSTDDPVPNPGPPAFLSTVDCGRAAQGEEL